MNTRKTTAAINGTILVLLSVAVLFGAECKKPSYGIPTSEFRISKVKVYSGSLVRVIDGDTVVMSMVLTDRLYTIETLRILGLDTPELRGKHRKEGLLAKDKAAQWLKEDGWAYYVVTRWKRGKYGRLLADVHRVKQGKVESFAVYMSRYETR